LKDKKQTQRVVENKVIEEAHTFRLSLQPDQTKTAALSRAVAKGRSFCFTFNALAFF
jgi:hypothetical protein